MVTNSSPTENWHGWMKAMVIIYKYIIYLKIYSLLKSPCWKAIKEIFYFCEKQYFNVSTLAYHIFRTFFSAYCRGDNGIFGSWL